MAVRVPATVITGFLGAGKTTLLRHLLANAGGKRLAVIVNEFGELGIDGSLLAATGVAGGTEDDIVELANGCLCCTVADEFLPAMLKLLHRPNPPDHILIETSGLALPKPLLKAFDWPGIRMRSTVDGVIVVVDAPAMAAGAFEDDHDHDGHEDDDDHDASAPDHDNPVEEVFSDQLACADMVLLNKADLLPEAEMDKLIGELREKLQPGVKIVTTRHGVADIRALLGLGAAAEDDLGARPSHHDDEEGHDHDDFESFTVTLPEVAEPEIVTARARAVIGDHNILRLKGFLAVTGRDLRYVVQAVGDRISGYYDRPWKPGEAREGRLVVIGFHGLDQTAIAEALTDKVAAA